MCVEVFGRRGGRDAEEDGERGVCGRLRGEGFVVEGLLRHGGCL